MFARASTYELPEDQQDVAVRAFREALGQIGDAPGFRGAYFLLPCEGERAVTLVLWDTRDAMETSRVMASRLRSEAAREAGGGVVSVEEFQVAVDATRPAPTEAESWS